MNFKPMLAPNETPQEHQLTFPKLLSVKLDGFRCIFKEGKMLTRSLKELPNAKLQERFKAIKEYTKTNPIILDGEIYSHELTFQEITHFCMTHDTGEEAIPDSLKFHAFDCLDNMDYNRVFLRRLHTLCDVMKKLNHPHGLVVQQITINTWQELQERFNEAIDRKFEGVMLKCLESPYKFGRATMNQNWLLKFKPWITFDAPIVEVYERMENTSESYTNELGQSQKHRRQEDMIGTGMAGGVWVDLDGVKQKVALAMDDAEKKDLWNRRDEVIGKWIEFKGMTVGAKDKVRHPVMVRWRTDKE